VETKNFLLEIGSEEIPAGYITPALEQIDNFTQKWFQENQIRYNSVTTYATPRRLTLFISDLSEQQDVSEKLVLGPPARIAYDEKGNLTKAGLGFAKSQGVEPSQLFKQQTEKGDYLAVNKTIGGKKTETLLPTFSKEMISKISFPKSMYWEPSQFRYARPIRWVVSLFGEEVIPFEIADVNSDRNSYGHSIRSSHKIPLERADLHEYKEKLRNAYVIVDQQDRKTTILEKLEQFGTEDKDLQLLETVTYLVESPSMIQGDFNSELLYLPPEVLITSMKHHQKYFPVISSGKLQPHFLSIHNSATIAEPNIKIGNERVLNARLSDAQFFWTEDTKTSLMEKNKKLSGLLFQAKLGNYDKKVERVIELSSFLANQLKFSESDKTHAYRAAELCKSDLVTEMVKEFPELQGVMGKWYASSDERG
jgi:glycyl-tRNA synthetase beta chain